MIFDKDANSTQWEKVSSINSVGKTDLDLQTNESKAEPYTLHKNQFKVGERNECKTWNYRTQLGETS